MLAHDDIPLAYRCTSFSPSRFYEIMPLRNVCKFTPRELQFLMSGSREYDMVRLAVQREQAAGNAFGSFHSISMLYTSMHLHF